MYFYVKIIIICIKVSLLLSFSLGPVNLVKALNTVMHNIQLDKLDSYDISKVALELLKKYLTNRKQYLYLYLLHK